MADVAPPDPWPFASAGPEAGNRGRLLFGSLVQAFAEALARHDIHGAVVVLNNSIGALDEDDLRKVVYFAVGLEAANQLGLPRDDD